MSGYDKTAKFYANQREQQLRKMLREEFGTRKYRIVGSGPTTEVHAYGQMPNTNKTGWYLLGGIREVENRYWI